VKRYRVKVNGLMTTLRLSDADAAERGLVPTLPAEFPVVEPDEDDTDVKARQPANKSRRPANKSRRRDAAAMAFVAKTGDE
jgi:hypothetical protein